MALNPFPPKGLEAVNCAHCETFLGWGDTWDDVWCKVCYHPDEDPDGDD